MGFFDQWRRPRAQESTQNHTYNNNSQRASTYPGTSRPRTADASRSNRTSIFGGIFVSNWDAPPVPDFPEAPLLTKHANASNPRFPTSHNGTENNERRSRRFSLSRKHSEPVLRRPWNFSSTSLSSKSHDQNGSSYIELDDMIPPVPALPQAPAKTLSPTTPTSLRPQTLSRRASAMSLSQRLSQHMWKSANPPDPEDEEEDSYFSDRDDHIPPVPALVRTGSESPESEDYEFKYIHHHYAQEKLPTSPTISKSHSDRRSRHTSTFPPPPPPVPRAPYVPKNAAKSFRMSAGGVTEIHRRTYRRSMGLRADAELVCVTAEQAYEWEKLKSLMLEMQLPRSAELEDGDDEVDEEAEKELIRNTYANQMALRALEADA